MLAAAFAPAAVLAARTVERTSSAAETAELARAVCHETPERKNMRDIIVRK